MATTDAQMQAMQDAKDIDTGVDSRSKKEMLAEQMSDLKTIGKVGGELAVESIPGVSEEISMQNIQDALARGDKAGAGIEAGAMALGVVPFLGDAAAKVLRKFNKTREAYKLLVQKPDSKLYPLFVQANKNLPEGDWLEAEFPETAFLGKTAKSDEARLYVPTKGAEREPKLYFLEDKQISKEQYDALGNNRKPDVKVIKGEKTKGTGTQIRVPDKATADKLKKEGFRVSKSTEKAPHGTVEAVAGRGGFHASQAPVATHLGPEDIVVSNEEVTKLLDAGMTPDAVKTKVFSYTPDGKPISKENIKKLSKEEQAKVVKRPVNYIKRRAEDQVFAVVDMADDVDYQSMLAKEGKTDLRDGVPKGGSYRYSDGQADSDQWVVGGDMKIQRVLSREEARAIQKEKNVTDLLYKDEIESILGRKFAKGGIVMDDYLVGKTMDEPQNFAEGGDVMSEAQAKLDTGVKDLRADRKVQFDKMTEQLTSGAVKDMELEEQENFVALYKLLKQHHSFAEGGAVPMKEQMSMFEDGGLMDEGGSIDPVSGNDVPPGSTQEEVRDDIPAQLSEGEFVFPADVVRFIGLNNLMQMRQQAKMGLKTMEDMGQMGNSDEATMPDDLPFDINDLDMEDDGVVQFADGGLAGNNANTGVFFNPAAGATTGVAAAPVEAASQQFVEPVRPAQADVPTMKSYTAAEVPKFQGFVGQNIPGVDFEYVEYTDEAGNIIKIRKSKSTGELLDPIPEGYTFVDPTATKTQDVTTKSAIPTTTQVSGDGREQIEKEEAMFGPGGGRISLGGNLDPDRPGTVSGATQFGVSFSGLGGLPGVGSMAMTGLSLATGKPIPDDARATITRDGVSVTISGTDYNKMKSEKFRGKTSDSIMDKWQQEKNEVNKQKDLREYKRQALEELAAKSAEEIKAEKAEQDRQMRAAFANVADSSGDGAGGSMDTSFDTSGGEDSGDVGGGPSGPTGSQSEVDDFESDLG